MMYVRTYVRTYVSITLRNVAVTSRRNVANQRSHVITRNRSLSNIGRARCAAINSDLKKIIISKYINYTIGINDNNCVFVCNLILGW